MFCFSKINAGNIKKKNNCAFYFLEEDDDKMISNLNLVCWKFWIFFSSLSSWEWQTGYVTDLNWTV